MTTSGESESDDSEMGRLQGISPHGPFIIVCQPNKVTFLAIFEFKLTILGL